ncbi:MAG TPA: MarR family transcriptional regulator [Solirubrobacteraceae bacterium]|jgi:DNA-binding MarR family transcriptional regulator|nr:MarR family transcriptional regulator [Solirubrobacteraceae bacterium]
MQTDAVDRIIQAWARSDPSLDARPLEVVGRLLLCAHHVERALLAALKPFDLSGADFDVINTLRRRADEHGANPSDLAQTCLITTGAMTSRLDRLERAGLITRTPDPHDGRAVRVHLTPQGERLAKQALDAVLAIDEAFLEPLDQSQRDTVAAALKLLLLHSAPT